MIIRLAFGTECCLQLGRKPIIRQCVSLYQMLFLQHPPRTSTFGRGALSSVVIFLQCCYRICSSLLQNGAKFVSWTQSYSTGLSIHVSCVDIGRSFPKNRSFVSAADIEGPCLLRSRTRTDCKDPRQPFERIFLVVLRFLLLGTISAPSLSLAHIDLVPPSLEISICCKHSSPSVQAELVKRQNETRKKSI